MHDAGRMSKRSAASPLSNALGCTCLGAVVGEISGWVSGGGIAVVRCVQRAGLWGGNVVGGRAGCGAAVDFCSGWVLQLVPSGCDSEVQWAGTVGWSAVVCIGAVATARCSAGVVWVVMASVGVPGRVGCLVVVFENSRGQVGRNCVEWNGRLVLVSSLGGFCTKNLFSELCFWDICPSRHGVGPSGVGGYMKGASSGRVSEPNCSEFRSTEYRQRERCFG